MLKRLTSLLLLLAVASGAAAQSNDAKESKLWWSAGADLTTNYLWRGYDQSYRGEMFDPSVQYGVTLGYGKFYIDVWANNSLLSSYNEFDFTLGFEHKALKVTLYDVYCGTSGEMPSFFDDASHSLTATIDYTFFDRLRLHWGTTFLHSADYVVKDDGSLGRAFSSYFEVAYLQPVKELFDIEIIAGATPWTSPFWCVGRDFDFAWESLPKGFNVTNLSLMLSREFNFGLFALPINLGYTYNPTSNRHYVLLKAGVWF
ncbi:MAG: hypothetical protein IKA81_05090 [Alistipes sp.]|nr:hypothetical protein [Alistipes sp.]